MDRRCPTHRNGGENEAHRRDEDGNDHEGSPPLGRVRQTDHEDQGVGDQAEAVGQEAEDNQTEGEDKEEGGRGDREHQGRQGAGVRVEDQEGREGTDRRAAREASDVHDRGPEVQEEGVQEEGRVGGPRMTVPNDHQTSPNGQTTRGDRGRPLVRMDLRDAANSCPSP